MEGKVIIIWASILNAYFKKNFKGLLEKRKHQGVLFQFFHQEDLANIHTQK